MASLTSLALAESPATPHLFSGGRSQLLLGIQKTAVADYDALSGTDRKVHQNIYVQGVPKKLDKHIYYNKILNF